MAREFGDGGGEVGVVFLVVAIDFFKLIGLLIQLLLLFPLIL